MGAFTAITDASAWQSKPYHREIENAFYERFFNSYATGKPSWAVANGDTDAGDIIQSAAFWAARQTAVNTLVVNAVDKFVKGGSAGVPPAFPDINGQASVPLFAAGSEVWHLVCSGNYPRRRVTMDGYPSTGWAPQDRYCTAGDIIGPWLIRDLQLALCFLKWTKFSARCSWNWNASTWWYSHTDQSVIGLKPWNPSVFNTTYNLVDANLGPWESSLSGAGLVASQTQQLDTNLYGSTGYYYRVDRSTAAYYTVSVDIQADASATRLWFGGRFQATSGYSPAIYWPVGAYAYGGAFIAEDTVGILCREPSPIITGTRTVDIADLLARTADRSVPMPSGASDDPYYGSDVSVDEAFVLSEWQLTQDSV